MGSVHKLKTIAPYFEECWAGRKPFEVRQNDREFKIGDMVYLQEYDFNTDYYSGREICGTIQYILSEFHAIKPGFVVFSYSCDELIEGK